jgi:hypothetical protein
MPQSPQDEQLLRTVTTLLDRGAHNDAIALLNARIAQGLATDQPASILFLGEIAGLLIDAGSEGQSEEAVKAGLSLLENNVHYFTGLVTAASIDYNLGNAKSALVEIHNPNAFTPPGLVDHDLLLAAKNHYWKALRGNERKGNFARQIRTNLATALRKSGRIAEALTFYDEIIAADPTFTMAHFHRGLALLVFEHLSGETTISLLRQVTSEYSIAAAAAEVPADVRRIAAEMRDRTKKRLKALGYKEQQLQQELEANKREAAAHSNYRQFTLHHHLGLSDHSLYCHCNRARQDDLTIATRSTSVSGDCIPRLELILNRLKAEFGTARLLYHQATTEQSWNLYEREITFAELFEGELVSIQTELLRTSFRICLGILDKIALGVCELYDVAESHEKLYFEKFWQPTARKGKASTRWNALAAKNNPSLVALYSQATDLRSDGEWSLFKSWRNYIEHRFLILTDEAISLDVWKARRGTFDTRCVTREEFTERTLRLLQFTRSAIFNFTYCARCETRSRGGPSITRNLEDKVKRTPDRPARL